MISDARGKKFLLKLDMAAFPEQLTATHVIVGRLLWACGFNVTEDHVVYFRPDDLVIAADAVGKDVFGDKHPLRRDEVEAVLARVAVEPDGRLRGMASLWLDGKPLGGPPAEGVREQQTRVERMPWLERQERGLVRGVHDEPNTGPDQSSMARMTWIRRSVFHQGIPYRSPRTRPLKNPKSHWPIRPITGGSRTPGRKRARVRGQPNNGAS